MAEQYIVPSIYTDISDQSQGYFAFRFTCRHCYWEIETKPVRSKISTATNVMDLGVGLLGGFWGRAAEMGEKFYGSKWHQEHAEVLQKAWGEVKHNFHFCPKCSATICTRCFNLKLNLCVGCAPDLKVDAAQYQHELNVEAQRGQIQQNYRAPQFNTAAVPSAVTDEMIKPQHGAPPVPTGIVCPNCRRLGAPGKFCQDCGTQIPIPDVKCPQCSTKVAPNARFCMECGAKLQGIG